MKTDITISFRGLRKTRWPACERACADTLSGQKPQPPPFRGTKKVSRSLLPTHIKPQIKHPDRSFTKANSYRTDRTQNKHLNILLNLSQKSFRTSMLKNKRRQLTSFELLTKKKKKNILNVTEYLICMCTYKHLCLDIVSRPTICYGTPSCPQIIQK